MIKYSILIPARNGGKYLPTCVETIINQDFDDYELIISDDHSKDNSAVYLSTIDHPNVKIVRPPESMSMTEHWEWVLSKACGEWIIFVGQDDGLQPYFFKLAERLTAYARQKRIRTIISERSYFFWPGCEAHFWGDVAVSYFAVSQLRIHNCKVQALLALLGFQTYFELPQMYTSSIFHRDIIIEAKKKQNGKVFVTHPQDANLGAISCSLDNYYLKSDIPLGWIGTSPKSAGISIEAVSTDNQSNEMSNETSALKDEYLKTIACSKLPYHKLVGDFALGSSAIYFWGALLQTHYFRKIWINTFLLSKILRTLLFAGVFAEISSSKSNVKSDKIRMFDELIFLNKCNLSLIVVVSKFFRVFYAFNKLSRALMRRIKRMAKLSLYCKERWEENPNINMINVSKQIEKMIIKKRMIEKL